MGKGAHEPKAQTTEAYPGFHEICLEVSQGYPPPPLLLLRYVVGIHLYTWAGRRETKWNEVPCLRKLRDGRDLNPGPPDPEFEVLSARLQTRLHECALSCK